MSRDVESTIDRLAHAFTPAEWKRRSLVIASVVFVIVAALTVVQRALVADSTTGWVITGVHGAIVAIGVPSLIRYAWRDWTRAQG